MLGMVFTEFVEMMEQEFSPAVADEVLRAVPLANGGAFTAVGYYPHEDAVRLVMALSERTGTPPAELLRAFGRHLMSRFTEHHREMFTGHQGVFDLLAAIDGHIHVHVSRLYHNATLPRFTVLRRTEDRLELRYSSPRRMEALAVGLIEGAAAHFGQPCDVTHAPAEDGEGGTIFTVVRRAA